MSTDKNETTDKNDLQPAEGETRMASKKAEESEGGMGGLWLAGLMALVVGGVVMLAVIGYRNHKRNADPAAAAAQSSDGTAGGAADGTVIPTNAPANNNSVVISNNTGATPLGAAPAPAGAPVGATALSQPTTPVAPKPAPASQRITTRRTGTGTGTAGSSFPAGDATLK